MGVHDAPQWLPSAFVRSAVAAGATAPREQLEATARHLLGRWQEPDRHFHNVKHLIDMLARIDELAEETHHPDIVRLAVWYHGAIFDSTAQRAYSRSGGEDEIASAGVAEQELTELGIPAPVIARIVQLIVSIKRHDAGPGDIDCLALRDASLAVLAAEPQKYAAYRKAVRAEYAHLPPRHYVEARTTIVRKLLARRHLFCSPLGAQWEDAARENLTAELERLETELEAMGEAPPEESVTAAEAARGQVFPESSPAEDDRTGHVFAPVLTGAEAATRPPGLPTRPPVPAPRPRSAPSAHTPAEPRPAGPARPSSLESLPEDLSPARPTAAESPADARAQIAQASRDRVDAAVREGLARAERDRERRDRLDAARAERALDAAREQRRQPPHEGHLATPREGTGATVAGPPAPEPVATPDRAPEPTPHSGIEREPELFGRPRRKEHRGKTRR